MKNIPRWKLPDDFDYEAAGQWLKHEFEKVTGPQIIWTCDFGNEVKFKATRVQYTDLIPILADLNYADIHLGRIVDEVFGDD